MPLPVSSCVEPTCRVGTVHSCRYPGLRLLLPWRITGSTGGDAAFLGELLNAGSLVWHSGLGVTALPRILFASPPMATHRSKCRLQHCSYWLPDAGRGPELSVCPKVKLWVATSSSLSRQMLRRSWSGLFHHVCSQRMAPGRIVFLCRTEAYNGDLAVAGLSWTERPAPCRQWPGLSQ